MSFNHFLSKVILGLLFILSGSFLPTYAQTHKADSLLQIVNQNRNDISTFYAYKKLGELEEKKNAPTAVKYFLKAVSFPFHLEYAKDFVEVFNSLGGLYHILGKYDSSLIMHRNALNLAQKFNYENEIAQTCLGIALNFMPQAQHDSANTYLQQALAIWERMGNKSKQASVYVNLGNLLLDQNKYNEALNQFIKAEKIFEGPVEDKAGLSRALGNIGNIECLLGNYEKALDYTHRSLRLSAETGNELSVAYCHRLLGRIFRKKTAYDSALKEYNLANAIYKRRGDKQNESETYQNIGNINYDLHQFKTALVEYEKSLRIAHAISDLRLSAYSFSGIGYAWYELKEFDIAISYFDSSITVSRKTKNRYLVMDAYEVMSKIHEERNQFAEALKFERLYSELKDSITQEEHRQGAEEMEAKYQNEKKQSQIELLQKDQQVKNISLQQSRTLQSAMIVAFILLIIIGILVYTRHRLKHQAKRLMEIENMRNRIGRDLHDDIGSTLSSINIVSQLAIKESQPELAAKYFQRIADQSARMMESMSDMVWSLNPENDSLQKMVIKMKEFSAEILEPKNISFQFQGEESLNGTVLDVAKRKNIFLIFKETINNAAKYSEGSKVEISLSQIANELVLTISDNGKGFDRMKVQNGNGLGNMKDRAKEIDGILELKSTIGQGTTLKMKMPLT